MTENRKIKLDLKMKFEISPGSKIVKLKTMKRVKRCKKIINSEK